MNNIDEESVNQTIIRSVKSKNRQISNVDELLLESPPRQTQEDDDDDKYLDNVDSEYFEKIPRKITTISSSDEFS